MGVRCLKALKIIWIVCQVFFFLFGLILTLPILTYLHPEALLAIVVENRGQAEENLEPSSRDLSGMNFYLSGVNSLIPVWHLWPKNRKYSSVEELRQELARDDTKIVLYFHGTAYSRVPREKAYEQMTKDDGWHMISFDYRGFLEASGSFNGLEAIEDGRRVHEWLRSIVGREKKILWWCFSMGTGVCSEAAATIEGEGPDAILLEAPFVDFWKMLKSRAMFTATIGWIPGFSNALLDRFLRKTGTFFRVKESILKLPDVPVLHVHAKDDETVSYNDHFEEIRDAIQADKQRRAPYFPISIPACRKLAHYPISIGQAPDLVELVNHFWEELHFPGRHSVKEEKVNGTTTTKNPLGRQTTKKMIITDTSKETTMMTTETNGTGNTTTSSSIGTTSTGTQTTTKKKP